MLYHLTAELNNVLIAAGVGQNTAVDTQLLQSIRGAQIVTATNNTAAQISINTFVSVTGGSATTQDYSAGAAAPGIFLGVFNKGSGSCTVALVSGNINLVLGSAQAILVSWNGTSWQKVGGSNFTKVFISGSSATWKTPFSGVYKCTIVGGGGGGGAGGASAGQSGGGGGGGGTSIKSVSEIAGITFTYTVGSGGTAGNAGAGGSGISSTLGDGTITFTGNGGIGGIRGGATSGSGGTGGVGLNGDLNVTGQGGGAGGPTLIQGIGGGSFFGGGAGSQITGTDTAGSPGNNYGGGGAGGETVSNPANATGGAGATGVIVIEF